ncbi:MAG TPA: DUF1461 domain-containing protein [Patescibacteria group bacterium]
MRFLIGLLVFLSIFFLSFKVLVFNFAIYEFEFKRVDVYKYLDKEIADNQAKSVIGFHRGKNNLDQNFFSKNEIDHLTDVKTVIRKVNFFGYSFLFSLLVLGIGLMFLRQTKEAMSGIKIGSILSISFSMISILGALFFFNFIFEVFHKTIFKDNYKFNPTDSNLISLFPPEFFADFAAYLVLTTIGISFIILLFIWLVGKFCLKR